MTPQKKREIIFLLLCAQESESIEDLCDLIAQELHLPLATVLGFEDDFVKVREKLPVLDEEIKNRCVGTDFSRIGFVEKAILRLGFFELFFRQDLPKNIVIAEALRLTRKFGSHEALSFVNALLDKTTVSVK